MVKSGLVEKPDVSQYRLTLHLGMTILIYISLFWLALHIRKPLQLVNPITWRPIPVMGLMVITFICLTMIAGSLVAGLKAGFTYNTFPLMDGKIVPDGLWILSPFYLNFFENITMVQFQHRLLGCGSVILVTMLSFNFYRNSNGISSGICKGKSHGAYAQGRALAQAWPSSVQGAIFQTESVVMK